MGTVRVGEKDLMGRDQGQGQMEKGSRIEWEQMEKKEKGRTQQILTAAIQRIIICMNRFKTTAIHRVQCGKFIV